MKRNLVFGADSAGNLAICAKGDRVWRYTEMPGSFYTPDDPRIDAILDHADDERLDRFDEASRKIRDGLL